MSTGDPLADPRCNELLHADADHISDVASMLQIIAQNAGACIKGTHIVSDANWTGAAFEATQESIAQLTPGLEFLGGAYRRAANHLTTYAGVVTTEQPIFKTLKQNIEETQANIALLSSLQAQQTATVNAALTYAGNHPDLKGAALKRMTDGLSTDGDALTSTTSSLTNAGTTLSGLQSQGMKILEIFSDARHTAAMAIQELGDQAPQKTFGDEVLGDAEKFFLTPIHFVEGLVVSTFDAFKNLPGDTAALWDHFNMKNLEKFGGDVATVAGTLAILTGGGAVLAGAKDLDGVEATAGSLTKGAEGIALRASVVSAVAAAIQGKLGVAAKDAVLIALPVSKADARAEDSAADVLKARQAYSEKLTEADGDPLAAFQNLTPEEQKAFLIAPGIVAVPSTLTAAKQAETVAQGEARSAAKTNEIQGKAGDKIQEGIGDTVAPDDPSKKPASGVTADPASVAPAYAN